MIISYSHNFIFIHCRKTAGSSVALAFLPFLQDPDIFYDNIDMADSLPHDYEEVRPGRNMPYAQNAKQWLRLLSAEARYMVGMRTPGSHALYTAMHNRYAKQLSITGGNASVHASAQEIRAMIGEKDWKRMYKFCFARNPWDFMVSFYFWRSRRVKEIRPSFKEFVDIMYNGQERYLPFKASGWRNWRIYTIDDAIAVDYVASYDNLSSEVNDIAQYVGIKDEITVPRANAFSRPEKTSPASMYDAETVRKVAEMFAEEIQHFGWKSPKISR